MRSLLQMHLRTPVTLSRRLSIAVTGGLLYLLSGACVSAELIAAVGRVPYSLPFFVAESEGYFTKEGVKLRIEDCVFGRICLNRLLAGEVQIATVANSPIVISSLADSKFAILATISNSMNDAKLVARKSAGINSPKDLAGKRIGTFTGTSAQYFLDSYLLYYGIDPGNVTMVSLQPAEVAGALTAHQVDALAIFEPHAYLALKLLGADGIVLPSARLKPTAFNLVVDWRIAGQRDDDLRRILNALERANLLIRNQPLKAQAILKARLGLDQKFIDWIWSTYQYELSLEQSLIVLLESEARWASRQGYASRNKLPNYLDYLYIAPLAAALPTAVTVVK